MSSIKSKAKLLLSKNKNTRWGSFLYTLCRKLWRVTIYCYGNLIAIPKAYRIKKQIVESRKQNKKIILLFGAPNHSNLGDNARTVCIHDWIKENYKGHELFIFNFTLDNIYLKIIKPVVQKEDMIFLHSGYHITDMFSIYYFVYAHVFKLFPGNPIFFFPQTVNFVYDRMLNQLKETWSKHEKFIFSARDVESHKIISPCFQHAPQNLLLMPDIVTSLIGKYIPKNIESHGILCCLRNDSEKKWNTSEVFNALKAITEDIKLTDTTLGNDFYEDIEKKRQLIHQQIDYFSQFKAIVTDRFHGTIFSLIANVPVIVIDSTDHKLSSGVHWFMLPEFEGRIYYAQSLNDMENYVRQVMVSPPLAPPRPILYDKYYANLKSIVDKIYS